MHKIRVFLELFIYCGFASAQWAVLDESVRKLVEKISYTNGTSPEQKFEAFDPHSDLNAKFEEITTANPADYIDTVADCGDPKLNVGHYNACLGLRNLRLKTLEQTQAMLGKIQARRTKIGDVIDAGRRTSDAGLLQKQQFLLQGLQANMQLDVMELEALRYGYKQRETMYEMQMAEARRATDTRAPAGPAGFRVTLPVKFPR
jgi:hypothetical protein